MSKSTKSGCKPNWSLFTKEIGGEMDEETNIFLLCIILIMTRCNSLNDENRQKISVKIHESPLKNIFQRAFILVCF